MKILYFLIALLKFFKKACMHITFIILQKEDSEYFQALVFRNAGGSGEAAEVGSNTSLLSAEEGCTLGAGPPPGK